MCLLWTFLLWHNIDEKAKIEALRRLILSTKIYWYFRWVISARKSLFTFCAGKAPDSLEEAPNTEESLFTNVEDGKLGWANLWAKSEGKKKIFSFFIFLFFNFQFYKLVAFHLLMWVRISWSCQCNTSSQELLCYWIGNYPLVCMQVCLSGPIW